jgi:ATP-dependent DNA ligase
LNVGDPLQVDIDRLLGAPGRRLEDEFIILDGEVAVFDQDLQSRFEWLRRRQPIELGTPPILMAFD